MPPRTRKTAQPEPEPEPEPEPDETTVESATEGDDEGAPETPAEAHGAGDDGASTEDAPTSDGDKAPEPERSDLQAVDAPCTECFPNGWPAHAYSVGCAHGTWLRETTD